MSMRSRILDVDPLIKRHQIHHFDEDTKQTTIETVQDAEPIVEINKALHNDMDIADMARKHNMVKVASIPVALWMDLKAKGIVDDPKRYRAWLNDPNNRFFRTSSGKV